MGRQRRLRELTHTEPADTATGSTTQVTYGRKPSREPRLHQLDEPVREDKHVHTASLHGRDPDVAFTVEKPGVSILAGDSGIGKSALLHALPDRWPTPALFGTVQSVSRIDGAFQEAVAESLGHVVVAHRDAHPGDLEIWTRLTTIVTNTGDAIRTEGGALAVNALFGFVESKLGAETGRLIRSALTAVVDSAADTFHHRLSALATRHAARELVDLASQIQRWVGAPIVIRIDDAEKLSTNDAAILEEMATIDSPGVHIVVGVSTAEGAGQALLHVLKVGNARHRELDPLHRSDIDRWLAAAAIPVGQWNGVADLSSGYPLFIQSAIDLVNDGGDITALRGSEAFVELLNAAWKRLPSHVQDVAKHLSVFVDSPDTEFLVAYLDVDLLEIETLRQQLIDVHVFVESADGDAWFHDRRRAHVWERILTRDSRRVVAASALTAVQTWLAEHSTVDHWLHGSLAQILDEAPDDAVDARTRRILGLSRDELALLWALIEVVDPAGHFETAAPTAQIVQWAVLRAGRLDDPLGAMQRLVEQELIVSVSDEGFSVSGLLVPSTFEFAVTVALIRRTFAVSPLQSVTSLAVQQFVLSAIPRYNTMMARLGRATLRSHSNTVQNIGKELSPRRTAAKLPALAVDFTFEGLAMNATLTFDSEADRDAAATALDLTNTHPRFAVTSLFKFPPRKVRWKRLTDALDRVAPTGRVTVGDETDVLALYRSRARSEAAMYEQTGVEETSALGFARPRRYLIHVSPDMAAITVFEVVDAERFGADLLPPDVALRDPLMSVRLRADEILGADEHIGTIHWNYISDSLFEHPTRSLMTTLEHAGTHFNAPLPAFTLPEELSALETLLESSLAARHRLRDALSADNDAANSHYIMVDKSPTSGLRTFGWSATAIEVADGLGRVLLRELPRTTQSAFNAMMTEEEANLFDVAEPSLVISRHDGDAAGVFAPLLGYHRNDVRVPLPPELLARAADHKRRLRESAAVDVDGTEPT